MAFEIGPYHPSREEEVLPELPTHISDPDEDRPKQDEQLPSTSAGAVSPIILGCAVFGYGIYAAKEFTQGAEPVKVLRYALRAGINAFDTSPWYHPSEIVMGRCLAVLKDEFPRESYQLITKVGKYGPKAAYHTYDRRTVVSSIERSLKRLRTTYLDVVYLHDVEFVTSYPQPCRGGDQLTPLKAYSDPSYPTDQFKLRPPYISQGPGDDNILEGLSTLAELRQAGKIRKIGIAGYPLPLLLRLSLLARERGIKLDIVQTYAQQTIINPSLTGGYIEAFERAGVELLTNAAPLAMGILTPGGGPDWHPARNEKDGMFEACQEASKLCEQRGTSLPAVSLDFGYEKIEMGNGNEIPVVIGCKSIEEIRRTIKTWREVRIEGVRSSAEVEKANKVIQEVTKLFDDRGVKGKSWTSPTGSD